MRRQTRILEQVVQLDPKHDHQRIVYLVGAYEYPWLTQRALEFALFRTYAVPHTSRILAATGQFERHGQKRYDDTALMLAGLAEHGYDSEFGRTVIATMNRLHGRWSIRNVDMLYVLSTFVFEPIRWARAYGARQPTHHENLANFHFWREVGIRMGIENIPESIEAFEAFNIAHEAQYFAYDDANRTIAEATLGVFLGWFPSMLHPLIRPALYALMDDPLLDAFGYPRQPGWWRALVRGGLRFKGHVRGLFPSRRRPYHFTELPNRTYPDGFTPADLGAREG